MLGTTTGTFLRDRGGVQDSKALHTLVKKREVLQLLKIREWVLTSVKRGGEGEDVEGGTGWGPVAVRLNWIRRLGD